MPGEISSCGDRPIMNTQLYTGNSFNVDIYITYVPLAWSNVACLLFLNFRMITVTRRMTRIVTNSTPDAEHVPTMYSMVPTRVHT